MGSTASHTRSNTYHPNAFKFVYSALKFTQEQLGRDRRSEFSGEARDLGARTATDGEVHRSFLRVDL